MIEPFDSGDAERRNTERPKLRQQEIGVSFPLTDELFVDAAGFYCVGLQ
jgi:hypothetical protein